MLTGAMIIASAAALTSAQAEDVGVTSCIGGWRGYTCVDREAPASQTFVRDVPEPIDAAEKARREAGDHKWLARCRPVIQHDFLGVSRYRYSAPGCEFGVSED